MLLYYYIVIEGSNFVTFALILDVSLRINYSFISWSYNIIND